MYNNRLEHSIAFPSLIWYYPCALMNGAFKYMTSDTTIKKLFEAGTHYGYSRSRRNPTVVSFIFGQKNKNDIFDLEITEAKLEAAKDFVKDLVVHGKKILFVSGKNESKTIMRRAAEKVDEPFVCSRWIGGTFTNFKEISKRVRRLLSLRDDKEKGNLDKYTKKERLLMDREIDDLEGTFGGIVDMPELPSAVFIVDPRYDNTTVQEAKAKNIPVVALANSDCDISMIKYPIPGNDATTRSISFIVDEMVSAIEEGKKAHVAAKADKKEEETEK